MSFSKSDFGDDFYWGVSIASAQNEGAADVDGKSPSIWDVFAGKRGNIKSGHSPASACDFYNRYQEDINTAKALGFNSFRFSLSWPRIMPYGKDTVNPKGIKFYHDVIDACLAAGLTPFGTLYHWDLPQALEEKGGWTTGLVIEWFSAYVKVCAKAYGDKVKNWIILNEPLSFTTLGYMLGKHAPGKTGLYHFLPTVHHAAMAQAEGGRIIRSMVSNSNIGTSFSCSEVLPYTASEEDMLAASKVDLFMNRLFIEPLFTGSYPVHEDFPLMEKLYFRNKAWRVEEKLKFDFDFIGLQSYFPVVVKHSSIMPHIGATQVKAKLRKVPATAMGWEINPDSFYRILKKFAKYKNIKEIIVTENGAAFKDEVKEDMINDIHRQAYFEEHVSAMLKARNEGVPVTGYFAWTLTDNFEWSEGYHPRFGLVHVDHITQQRRLKRSGFWWQQFLQAEYV
jgi:beta-glucosidase